MQLSSGAKGWLWFLLIVNIIGGVCDFIMMFFTGFSLLFGLISSILLIVGVAFLLFQQKKLGFYLMCGAAGLNFLISLFSHTGIIASVIGAALCPLITYLILKNCWEQLN